MLQPGSSSFGILTLPLFLFLTVLFPIVCSFRAAVFFGQVNQRDTNKPFYEVHLPRINSYKPRRHPLHFSGSFTPMQMVSARGQVFTCMVPNPTPSVQGNSTTVDPEAVFDDIDELFRDYEEKCFMRQEDWWTYEFCYGKHVVQKHIIPPSRDAMKDEVEDKFVLGLFDPEADKIRRKNASQVSTPDAAFTQLFTNGTICDMTKKPRRVTIKYICNEDALQLGDLSARKAGYRRFNVINAIREIESCVYEIEFINAAICQHSTYRAKLERNSRAIHCSLEKGQKPFKGLTAKTYQRSSLSL